MATRHAACHCGQLELEVDGRAIRRLDLPLPRLPAPDRERLRDAAGFDADRVEVAGRCNDYTRDLRRSRWKEHVFHFCPGCGSQVFYTEPTSRAGSSSPSGRSRTGRSRHRPNRATNRGETRGWGCQTGSSARPRALGPVRPRYEAGEYAEAADRGRALIEANPEQGFLYFNVGLCESLAGRDGRRRRAPPSGDRHVGGLREMAKEDSDFDPIRTIPRSKSWSEPRSRSASRPGAWSAG